MLIQIFHPTGAFRCTTWEESKCNKEFQVTVKLPCLGYDTDKKNILMHLLVSLNGIHKLRGSNLACHSYKTNILGFDDGDRGVGHRHTNKARPSLIFLQVMHNS